MWKITMIGNATNKEVSKKGLQKVRNFKIQTIININLKNFKLKRRSDRELFVSDRIYNPKTTQWKYQNGYWTMTISLKICAKSRIWITYVHYTINMALGIY